MKTFVILAILALTYSLDNGLALTPPMVCFLFRLFNIGLDAMGAVPLQYRLQELS